jgi:hypothetical protein
LYAGLIALPIFVLTHLLLILRVEPVLTWFYPIVWWSYIFLVDSVVYYRTGRSLIWDDGRRIRQGFWIMAAWSVVIWLIFEAFNLRLENWWYHNVIPERGLRWAGIVISFATVVPLLAQTDRLLESVGLFERAQAPRLTVTPGVLRGCQLAGGAMLLLTLAVPHYAFPLVWGGFIMLLDPVNYRSGAPSLLRDWEAGSLRRIYRLLTVGLITGMLWEFWNYWAIARWSYTVPFVDELKIFEMPVLGFLGFPPFTLEAFVLYNFLCWPWRASIWPGLATPPPAPTASRWHTLTAAALALLFIYLMLKAIDHHTILSFS